MARFINDAARIPRARESIAFAAGHVFNPEPELLYSAYCIAFSLNCSALNELRQKQRTFVRVVQRTLFCISKVISPIMFAAFQISHRDERRGGQNGRRQCAIYNFYSAHMSTEIVARAWASVTRRFTKFYEAPPTTHLVSRATSLGECSLNDFRVQIVVVQCINYLYKLFALSPFNKSTSVRQRIMSNF